MHLYRLRITDYQGVTWPSASATPSFITGSGGNGAKCTNGAP